MRLPRFLTVRKSDFNLDLLGKFVIVFTFTGVVLTPIIWLTGLPLLQTLAEHGWNLGRGVCSDTGRSFTIGGVPLMICARCFGVTVGMLAIGLLYHYTRLIRPLIPAKRLHIAVVIALLFLPWLIDSGLERFGLWQTNLLLMFVTGFLAGSAMILAPRIFWPVEAIADDYEEFEFTDEELQIPAVASPAPSRPLTSPAADA